MEYAPLGDTGVFVSRFCLGTMTFGGTDTPAGNAIGRLSQGDADLIVGTALDRGINFIDTADVYGGGSSESIVGVALRERRNDVVLATKMHARVGPGPNQVGQSRLHLMNALEASLRRLKTDRIDLYQVHNFDPLTPLDEILRVLDDVVRQGKVRYIGCSNFAAWQLAKALGISQRDRLSRFVSIQSFYSIACRDLEHEVIPAALDGRISILCWSPLAGGLLSGKFDRHTVSDDSSRRALIDFPPVHKEKAFDIIDILKKVALNHDATPAGVALAWTLGKEGITSVITGVKSPKQLQENLKAFDLQLTDSELEEIDRVSSPSPVYPGWIQTYNAASRVPPGYQVDLRSWVLGQAPV